MVDDIVKLTGRTIHIALDTHSTPESQLLSVHTFGPGKGKLLTILPPGDEASKANPDVSVQGMSSLFVPFSFLFPLLTVTLIYTSLGQAFSYRGVENPASPEDRAHMVQFLHKVPELIKSGAIRPNRVKLWEGGLAAIPEGLEYMRSGKLSAEKIVYKVSA